MKKTVIIVVSVIVLFLLIVSTVFASPVNLTHHDSERHSQSETGSKYDCNQDKCYNPGSISYGYPDDSSYKSQEINNQTYSYHHDANYSPSQNNGYTKATTINNMSHCQPQKSHHGHNSRCH